VVGLIGPNGAGKTTLLKMIAGLLPVDQGKIEVQGKITALLALGVGVHPEFTGRENILYGGMLLGMSKREVLRKTEGIIEFAELGDHIDRPFRTYSSGMKARLLFSISMSIDPDILIVDEALALGDHYFVHKASQRIGSLCRSGATILLVSHNLSQIEQLCQRAYLMAEGRILHQGSPSSAIAAYNQLIFEKEQRSPLIVQNQGLEMLSGSGEVVVTDIKLRNAQGEETVGFFTGEKMEVEIHYRSSLPAQQEADLFVGFVLAKDSSYIGEINTVNYVESFGQTTQATRIALEPEGVIRLSLEPLLLLNNHYALWIILYERQRHYYCEYKNVAPFFVARRDNTWMRNDAVFWHLCKIASQARR
jgi:ABC-type polysaccharide/polyol phosphate transport system ATPase subunit